MALGHWLKGYLGEDDIEANVSESVSNWLEEHPEATTTVQDGAVTTPKLADGAVTTPKLANGSVTDDKLADDGIKAEVSDLKSDLEDIQNDIYTKTVIDTSNYSTIPYSINGSTNKWVYGTNRASIFVPINGAKKVKIIAGSGDGSVVALMKSLSYGNGASVNYATGASRVSLNANETVILDVPSDCTYITMLEHFNSTSYLPAELSFYTIAEPKIKTIPIGLHTMPENDGVLNVIKRCRQMTDIEWTPAIDLPRLMAETATPPYSSNYDSDLEPFYIGVFKQGKTYKGIPYGRSAKEQWQDYGYNYTFVGTTIDFDTFVTAVSNPESVISKDSVGSIALRKSMPYASVCSSLVSYALNVSYVDTSQIPNISGLNKITDLTVDGAYIDTDTFKLGDVLNLVSNHAAIITDIIKDSDDEVAFIEVSESTVVGNGNRDVEGGADGGLCRRKGFSVNDFFGRFGDYSLYRYNKISEVPYTPSPFVNVGDELDMFRLVHLPCMPYMGENFKYKSGYIPNTKIVITCNDYAYLRVFKDGTEITGSPFTVGENDTYIETGFSAVGEYEAYLCNMSEGANTAVTAKCHWSVVE